MCPSYSWLYRNEKRKKYKKENKKEWINKKNNNSKKTKAEIIPSNMYSNYEEKGE